MKKAKLFLFFVCIAICSFSQSKKELEEQIIQLQQKFLTLEQKDSMLSEKNKFLESEIASLKLNLLSTTTSLNLMSGKIADLEKTITEQERKIAVLARKNDSLSLVNRAGNSNEALFVSPTNEEDSILFLMQTYFAAKKWEERVSLVLKPESTKQMMKEYYTGPLSPDNLKREDIYIQGSNFKLNEIFKVSTNNNIYYIKKTADGFKIDWIGSVGYNPFSLKTFSAINSTSPKVFRVKASFNSSYNNDGWWSFNLESSSFDFIYVYVRQTSPEGKKLSEILKDGKDHQLMLELKWVLDNPDDQHITVSKFIQEGWSQEK